MRQKFADSERDGETGLDYMQARYYGSPQGRFTSVDPLSGVPKRPQSWNAYAYALNNPLRFIDPDGLRWAQQKVEGGVAYAWFDDKEDENGDSDYKYALEHGWSKVSFDENKTFTTSAIGEDTFGNPTITTTTLNPNGSGSQSVLTLNSTDMTILTYGAALGLGGGYLDWKRNFDTALNDAYNNVGDTVSKVVENAFDFASSMAGGGAYKKPKPGLSGKEGAKDIPSWAQGEKPLAKESGNQFAERLCDKKYGPGKYPKRPGSEYSKLKKFADRNFQ